MRLLGRGKSREAWLREDGRVEKRARPDAAISPKGWRKHAERLQELESLGVPVAKVCAVWEYGVLVEWVEGPTLKEAAPLSQEQRNALHALAAHLSSLAVYPGDLNHKNLVWNRARWVVVDCGAIRRLPAEEVHQRLADKWKRYR